MKNNRRLFGLILAILVLAVSTVTIAAIMQPSAEDILLQALETSQAITDGHAVVDVNFETPEKSGSGTVEAWGRLDAGPNGEPAFRIEVLNASIPEAIGAIAVSDGFNFWLWHPGENTVLTGNYEQLYERLAAEADGWNGHDGEWDHDFDPEQIDVPETPEEAVAKLLEYFTAEKDGTEDLAAGEAYRLRLIPIPEQMPDEVRAAGGLLDVWIRTADSAPLSVAYSGGAVGSASATATFLELNQGVDDAVFTFEIPEGAVVIDAADLELPEHDDLETAVPEADLLTPTDLPQGATLLDTVNVRGAMVQRYSLPDGRSFTVAQGPPDVDLTAGETGEAVTVRGLEGTLYSDEDSSRTLLNWQEGNRQFWIGGDLTPEQALALAESLR